MKMFLFFLVFTLNSFSMEGLQLIIESKSIESNELAQVLSSAKNKDPIITALVWWRNYLENPPSAFSSSFSRKKGLSEEEMSLFHGQKIKFLHHLKNLLLKELVIKGKRNVYLQSDNGIQLPLSKLYNFARMDDQWKNAHKLLLPEVSLKFMMIIGNDRVTVGGNTLLDLSEKRQSEENNSELWKNKYSDIKSSDLELNVPTADYMRDKYLHDEDFSHPFIAFDFEMIEEASFGVVDLIGIKMDKINNWIALDFGKEINLRSKNGLDVNPYTGAISDKENMPVRLTWRENIIGRYSLFRLSLEMASCDSTYFQYLRLTRKDIVQRIKNILMKMKHDGLQSPPEKGPTLSNPEAMLEIINDYVPSSSIDRKIYYYPKT